MKPSVAGITESQNPRYTTLFPDSRQEPKFRGAELKDDLLHKLLAVQTVRKFEPSISFIRKELGPYKSCLVFAPSTVPEKVEFHLIVHESNPPLLESFNLNGVELLVNADEVGDLSPRFWGPRSGRFTVSQLERSLADLWKIPAEQISIDCGSKLDRSADCQLPKDCFIRHPGNQEF